MELTDGVITVRTPIPADAEPLVAAVQASIDELVPWMPWASADYDVDVAHQWINKELDDSPYQGVIVDADGHLVGSSGINKIDGLNQTANLGYWVRSDVAGRGYATRATRLLAEFGIREAGLECIEVIMSVDNSASRRVAERAGAAYEGVLRRRLFLQGRPHDVHVFSFTKADFD